MRNVLHIMSGISEFPQLRQHRRSRFFNRLFLQKNDLVKRVVNRLLRDQKSFFIRAVIASFDFGVGLFVNSLKAVSGIGGSVCGKWTQRWWRMLTWRMNGRLPGDELFQ